MMAADASAHIRLPQLNPGAYVTRIMSEDIARKYCMAPLWVEADELVVACADPYDRAQTREAARLCRHQLRVYHAGYTAIHSAIDQLYHHPARQHPLPDPADLLYRLGYLDLAGLNTLREVSSQTSETAIQICHRLQMADDQALAEVTALTGYLPHLRLGGLSLQADISMFIPWETVQAEKILPLSWLQGSLLVGFYELPDENRLTRLADEMGIPIIPVICSRSEWERASRRLYLHTPQVEQPNEPKIADWLVKKSRLQRFDLETALSIARQTRRPLAAVLLENGLVTRESWLEAKAQAYGLVYEQPGRERMKEALPDEILQQLPAHLARHLHIVPVAISGGVLTLGVSEPQPALSRLAARLTGLQVQARLMDQDEVSARQNELYGPQGQKSLASVPLLGSLMRLLGVISPDQLQEALQKAAASERYLGEQLVNSGYLDDIDLAEMLSLQTGIPNLRLDHARLDEDLITRLPAALLLEHRIIPLWTTADALWLAVADPFDVRGLHAIQQVSGKQVIPLIAPRKVVLAVLERLVGATSDSLRSQEAHIFIARMLDAGFLTQAAAALALSIFEDEKVPLDQAVCRASGRLEIEVARFTAEHHHINTLDLQLTEREVEMVDPIGQMVRRTITQDPVDPQAARLVSFETADRLSALPVRFEGGDVVVAFADPLFQPALDELSASLERKIIPVMVTRHELNEAVQRNLGRRNLGTHLLLEGIISRPELNRALDYARRTGVRLGRALISLRLITWEQLYEQLSRQSAIPFHPLAELDIDHQAARLIQPDTARRFGLLPVREHAGQVSVAIVDPYDEQALQFAREHLGGTPDFILITEKDFDEALEQVYRQDFLDRSISELLERSPEDSAFRVLSRGQIIFLIALALISIIWLFVDAWNYLIVINAIISTFYLVFSAYRFYLIYRALSRNLEVEVTPEEVASLKDADLPVYTILIPVYREADVLPGLLNALERLDYPKSKLDIKILMEEDDQETIQAFHDWNPPAHFHGIVVPYGQPKTKPKACNYGLIHARGEYIVIFDAEDLPDPDQLKKIVIAFGKVSPDVVCIQSKLNYYNQRQNLLTRWFTVEYSMWFDLFLPGLDASGAPIPLGGTSNHFRTAALIDAGAWDPYNVTEDADLGIRLYKRGYKTAIIDSTTYEEANSQIYNWIRQRSRWIKGYIQTWLVHMRHPIRLWRETGWRGFWGFQFTVGGAFVAVLLNPIYWIMTTLWFWRQFPFINIIFPGIIYFFGAFCLFIGNFAFTYMNVAGALRRGYYDMVKHALLSPIYWGLASVAAWKGFFQLITQPHYWEKTQHGLHLGQIQAASSRTQGTQDESQ